VIQGVIFSAVYVGVQEREVAVCPSLHGGLYIFQPYHFSMYLNQFSYFEGGGSTFFQNVGTFNHYTIQKPKRRPSSDI
jgi:hypothetical protein